MCHTDVWLPTTSFPVSSGAVLSYCEVCSIEEMIMTDESRPDKRKPLVTHHHRKRSVTQWLVLLALIIAIMIFLPKILALLE